jgi:hypothetical protein
MSLPFMMQACCTLYSTTMTNIKLYSNVLIDTEDEGDYKGSCDSQKELTSHLVYLEKRFPSACVVAIYLPCYWTVPKAETANRNARLTW